MRFAQAWRAFIALLLIATAALTVHAQPVQPVPALTARVIDHTGTLSADERRAIETRLQTLEHTRGAQLVLLLVPTTAPEDIAAYANRVANAWKIGRRDVGDGLLLIVAKNDRTMRIEVAKSLEGAVPDIAAARIIDQTLKPHFRNNDFAGGLMAAIELLDARIAGEGLPAPTANGNANTRSQGGVDWESIAMFLFVGVMVGAPVARAVLGNRLGGLTVGGLTGAAAFVLGAGALLAGLAGLVALLFTWLGNLAPAARNRRHTGGWGGGLGGWGGTGSGGGWSSGGGFGSGGGGDFGGGGASGDW